jgi:PAS domain S-box-containing protein
MGGSGGVVTAGVPAAQDPDDGARVDPVLNAAGGQRGWSLRRYLVGLVVLFVVAAAAAMTYGWIAADRDARVVALQDAAFGAKLAAADVDGDVASVRQAVAELAANPGIGQAFAAPAGCSLEMQLEGGPDAGHVDLVRPDGTVVCSSRPASGAGGLGSYAGTAWWKSGSPATMTAPGADPRTGQPAVVITKAIPGAGVVAGFVNLAVLGRVLGGQYGGPWHLTFVLTTQDGATVLTRSAEPVRWIGTHTAGTPFGAGTAVGERRDVGGQLRLFQRAEVAGVGWRLYAGADPAMASAAGHRLAVRQILIIGCGLLVALLGALLVHRRITGPIGRLAAAVHGVADGVAGPVPAALPAGGPAEVAGLAGEFAGLMASVERELKGRRSAEQAAVQAQHSYREVFDHNPFPMIVVDTDTLAVLEVNDVAVAHYGYTRSEFLALTLTDLRLPEDVPALQHAIDQHAIDQRVEEAEQKEPVRHVRKDGSVIDVVVNSHALTFNGRPAWCAVIVDVTEKENAERRLRLAQRMESLGQLAGGVAHDFNNLLGVIAGYTRFAVDDLGEAARTDPRWLPLHEDLNQVLKATDRAAGLTRQLLSFARREIARPQAVDLNTVVTDVEQMLRRTIGDDITLHTDLAADLPAVTADPGQLEQVLLNLAVNARDAMPGGGTLAAQTDTITVDAHYAASRPGTQPGEYVRLRVSDSGTGMSPDTVERAFEPFFTTKPTGQGTGLGLATVYGIVTGAGGHIHLHSTPGVGTTVTVLLPATGSGSGTGSTAPHQEVGTHRTTAGRGEAILVVEDEDALRVLTERVLVRHGYKVITAANGPEALQVAADHPGPIDLLVTDVVMPDMPGHHLAAQLQQTRPGLPVIYVSGYAEPILATQKTLPADVTLLNKPVPEQLLLGAVRDTLDRADSDHRE